MEDDEIFFLRFSSVFSTIIYSFISIRKKSTERTAYYDMLIMNNKFFVQLLEISEFMLAFV